MAMIMRGEYDHDKMRDRVDYGNGRFMLPIFNMKDRLTMSMTLYDT